MPMIPVRDLARRTREVLDDVERTGRVAIVTRQGRPAVAIIPLDAEALEDHVLAGARDYLDAMREADEDLASGRTRSLGAVMPPRTGSKSERSGAPQRKPAIARSSSRR
jgi:prevent-host-death family protein